MINVARISQFSYDIQFFAIIIILMQRQMPGQQLNFDPQTLREEMYPPSAIVITTMKSTKVQTLGKLRMRGTTN